MVATDMAVNADLKALIELQAADSRIVEIEREKARLPEAIEAMRQEVVTSLAEYDAASRQVELLEARHEVIRRERAEEEERLAHTQERLPNITTQKAYYALLKEVETAERALASLAEEGSRIDAEAAELRAKLVEVKKGMVGEETLFEERKAAMEAEFVHLDKELETLRKKRQKAVAAVAPKALSSYKRIASRRAPLVVVEVRDGRCTGCHILLPPQLYVDVKRNDRIHLCGQCNRILYYAGEE
ncbi:MAG: hypothetical protein COW73_07215 [Nitrospirae bacterium CG18_big_fil_WC_8_21_14_2_50_70_55]|nr:hypothetical protein [Deltaproteobacteria bacterium]OIP65603.1 MAG: hypothetical protein AUK30_04495 [Nitrospirae bacterium CG2_30_70_394]PIQ04759.1 MAG: hypothetical protein COW73_07215 [Nitrospirae bacterium CG18_big_fil_WC_8_21_14_2_50_70_55]PIU78199.1 MAG: hypothetical protein COS73_07805 [Nitrospirae bacterium CG06_land_8_20_14_3_00_70_43]PIW82204.1 MAG: hypothetical protein COZ96_09755 [Nitrospirae bacterium CG_4_8_14_3_um_filter_70_85]PIX83234.1 MAG: hypothetical protein COZ33_06400 